MVADQEQVGPQVVQARRHCGQGTVVQLTGGVHEPGVLALRRLVAGRPGGSGVVRRRDRDEPDVGVVGQTV
jgi:hypothetical protein